MTDSQRSIEYATPEAYDPYAPSAPGGGPGPAQVPSPFGIAARALRGRWGWAILLSAVLGSIGAVIGYRIPTLLYQSTGWIEVQPSIPRILHKTDENEPLAMYDAYVESQVALASGRRVIDMAMDSQEWRKHGKGRTDEDINRFQRRLQVLRPSKALYVQVTFQDENPEVATAAVNAVMAAYMKLVDERESTSGSGRIRVLENKKTTLQNQLSDIRTTIQSVTEDRGADGLRERYQIAADELKSLDAQLSALDLEIATLTAAGNQSIPERLLTEPEIALQDSELARLLESRAQIDAVLANLENVQHKGSKDPDVSAARFQRAALERQIAARVQAFRAATNATPEVRAARLREREATKARFLEVRTKRDDEVKRLGKLRSKLENYEAEAAAYKEQLEEVKRVLEEITTESQGTVHGRIRIAQEGERPVAPAGDKRMSLAGLCGFGGLSLGFALVLAWGLRDTRMRHIADVSSRGAPGRFLGILPDVPKADSGEAAESSAEMGDYCIHHIRTMVQLRSRDAKRIVAMTSPSPGAGKTTLALSLAESFAAAGSRTLLIDCDLVGHGLTSAMRSLVCEDASRALLATAGDAGVPKFVRKHRVSELLAARGRSYGDAQVEELLAATREMAADGGADFARTVRALEGLSRPKVQGVEGAKHRRGILAAIDGAPIDECVLEVAQESLFVLPVGDARAGDATRLSHDGLGRLLETCRAKYDVVLIDTGPILGSLEAALVTSVADMVLLVVTRGEKQHLVNDAMTRLDEIGADIAGVIFNRAEVQDLLKSRHVSRSASVPAGIA